MATEKNYFGIILAIAVFVSATGISYLALTFGSEENILESGKNRIEPEQNFSESEKTSTSETGEGGRGLNPGYFSLTIGASMGALALAVWVGSSQVEEDVTTMLLEEGLEDMTVRDADIVRRMIRLEKFTVPQLVEKTDVSRTSVWRLVKRMINANLVEETGEKKLPKSGRGKPSKVYRYIGP